MSQGTENIKGLNLAAVKLTTVQVAKLPLYHSISNTGMICFAKPSLTEDLYVLCQTRLCKADHVYIA
jgi:hypothetical protein